ncbi:MAG: YqjF family protein [Pyrinomonadaceae bacterium]
MRKFLTARWQDLIMANYEVDPEVLSSRVPAGTELDLFEGRCFVSLVGFMFLDTRVLGIPVPWHVNFEEVNLRFYIKRETEDEVRRAVCFVKEIVPRYAIATVARVLYGEPYECWRMGNFRSEEQVSYDWSRDGMSNRMSVHVEDSQGVPEPNSEGEFIIEHYWGYTDRGRGRVDEYKVEHPKWELFSVDNPRIDVDFGTTYGEEFAFLSLAHPHSILLAKGSEIAVYKGQKLLL